MSSPINNTLCKNQRECSVEGDGAIHGGAQRSCGGSMAASRVYAAELWRIRAGFVTVHE
ncbi:hypothetical protein Hanom_Chr04g00307961 [Helianthus anomalus]